MSQYRLLLYIVLSIMTGSFALCMFCINLDNTKVNFNVLGCLFLVSFVGHIISFWRESMSGNNIPAK